MKRIISLALLFLTVFAVSCRKEKNENEDQPPVSIRSIEDLQKLIDEAEPYTEIRVEASIVLKGALTMPAGKYIKLTGGWVKNFTEQDFTKRSVIDGNHKVCCITSEGDNTVSGFELRNGLGSGINFSGSLTVEYCWIHNCFNTNKGGAIMNAEKPGDALLLANSILEYNKADAHGGAVSVSGKNTSMVIVNCLIKGNASIAQYGYTGAIHGQAGVQATLVNNTIVENVNWRDGSSATSTPWSVVMFRNGGTHVEMLNNIVAGSWYFLPGVANNEEEHPDRYDMPINPAYLLEMQPTSIDINEAGASDVNFICRSNVLGGSDPTRFIGRCGSETARTTAQNGCTFVHNSDYSTIFKDAAGGDYRPGTVAQEAGENTELVRNRLGDYMTDLAGKPRITGGKISAGCYEP